MADDVRVLIVDDHAIVRQGLRLFLELQAGIEVVGEAGDGEQAVAEAKRQRPDVVLMDLAMPGMDGITATRCVKEACPDAKVLVLTSFSDDEKLFPVLRAGASGYLMKDVAPEQIAEGIRTVHRGDPLLHPEALRRLMQRAAQARREPEGTVTILFTDIVDSSPFVQRLGDEQARAVFREHDCLLRACVDEHDGVEVKHQGDGLMVAFSSARHAALCAIDMQRAIARHNRESPEQAIQMRIGLNTGEVIAEEQDYFGEAVIVASRVRDAAAGGQILASSVTRALVGAGPVRFVERGEHQLKGLQGAYELFDVEWAEANGAH